MDGTVNAAAERIREIAANHDVPIDRLIVFGSRVREDYREHSDSDILLVSSAFEGVTYHKRPRPFSTNWNYEELPPPEFIALTPAEFEEQRRRDPHIVRTATEEGLLVS